MFCRVYVREGAELFRRRRGIEDGSYSLYEVDQNREKEVDGTAYHENSGDSLEEPEVAKAPPSDDYSTRCSEITPREDE